MAFCDMQFVKNVARKMCLGCYQMFTGYLVVGGDVCVMR